MKAMRAKAAAWLAGGMAVIAGAAFLLHRAPATDARVPTTASVAEAPPALLHIAWNKGERVVYDVTWTAHTRAAAPGIGDQGALEGDVRFAGALALDVLGEESGRTLIAARLRDVTAHALRVMNGDLVPTDDAARDLFDGREAFVSLEHDGRVAAYHFKR